MKELALWQTAEYTGMKPGLGRMRRFLRSVGDPQRSFAVLHVAGTNGKGSTAKMLAKILECSGYRTGLYTSPHLVDLRERIAVNSAAIAGRELESLARRHRPAAQQYSLTFFEFLTGLAFIYFASRKTDIVVLETGLGGRFDATNVIERPAVSVITGIDHDHRAILGKTLERIAFEKAGIIKRNCPVVSGACSPSARRVIRETASKKNAPLFEAGRDFGYVVNGVRWERGRQDVMYRDGGAEIDITLPLLGEHQALNASLAAATAAILGKRGWRTDAGRVRRALAEVTWPGRFDVRRRGASRTVILDGAHNPGAARRFAATLRSSPWGARKQTFIFGVLKDKDYRKMIPALAPLAKKVVLVPVISPRSETPENLERCWKRHIEKGRVASAASLGEAMHRTKNERVVVITGSLYLVGEAIKTITAQSEG